MPSIFSWRPSKLQVRLRKLSHQLGSPADGTAANIAFQSSDDEDEDDRGSHHRRMPAATDSTDESKRLIASGNPQPKSPGGPLRSQESSLSDDEYFCARSPRMAVRAAAAAATAEKPLNASGGAGRQRAVRFSEDITTPPRAHQPPVCNVAPTHFSASAPQSRSDSLQFRALTSPVPNAAALPPRYSPSPALKFAGRPPPAGLFSTRAAATSSGGSGDEASASRYLPRGAVCSGFDSTSENDTGGEYEEHENRRPPRPARSASAQGGTRNRANIILQHLRADNDLQATDSAPRSPYANTSAAKYSFTGPSADSAKNCFVFLEFNDEVKRSTFPTNIHSLEQIKSLFLRTFPNLSLEYLNQPYVKIYIQESTKSHLFYELDDIKDVKEHSLLKVREQQSHPQHHAHHRNFQSPPPAFSPANGSGAPHKIGVVEYVSEPEMEYGNGRARYRYYDDGGGANIRNNYGGGDYAVGHRPASVLPRMEDSSSRQYYPSPRLPMQFQNDQHSMRNLMSPITASSNSLPLPRMGTSYGIGGTSPGGSSLSSSSAGSLGGYTPLHSNGVSVSGAYYEPFYSSGSESSRASRSGSSTPIMMTGGGSAGNSSVPLSSDDESTRQRVDTMERQLAGLSTLVHSALITREMNPVVRQEMMQLQRQILELQAPSATAADDSITNNGLPQWSDERNPTLSPGASSTGDRRAAILRRLQCEIKNTRDELRQLKRVTQVSTHSCRELLMDAAERIRSELSTIGGNNPMSSSIVLKSVDEQQQSKLDGLRKSHLDKLASLQDALRMFEANVEEIRNSVLNSNRKLRMAEVEQLTNRLTQIGKDSAVLKTRFPELQTSLENEIRRNMENIVREENFIKEERDQVDECLRRCRNLANMMITMKKLAMVQDPTLKSMNSSLKSKSGTLTNRSTNKANGNGATTKLTGVATTIQNISGKSDMKRTPTDSTSADDDLSKAHVLDNILDELNFSPLVTKKALNTLPPPKSPPKPPERKRYHTTEIRLQYERENGFTPPSEAIPQIRQADHDRLSHIT